VEPIEDLQKKLGSDDEEERRSAVRALAVFPFDNVRELAFAALGDESWRVRKEAVDLILSFSRGGELAEELISLLSVQGNAGLRNSVVEVLQTIGAPVLPQLVENLRHDDPGVRKFIVDIMGGIGDATAVTDLTAVLADEDPNVAAAAAESLGLIGDVKALPHLLTALARDEFLIRYAVLQALAKIGRPVPLDLITPLADNLLLKKAVFECIGIIGGCSAVTLLADGLSDRARNVREAALVALDSIRCRCEKHELESVIRPCLSALVNTDAVGHLMSLRESSNRKIKTAALSILGLIGDARALEVFLAEYRNENMQEVSLHSLREMGPKAGGGLSALFLSADDETRCVIAHISGELQLPECVDIAAAGLRDHLPMVRALSAEAAGKGGMARLIPAVISLLDDDSADVRRKAVGALVRLATVAGDAVAASAAQLADSKNPETRFQSVRLLAALKDLAHLMLLSKDEDSRVRREALTCLGELRSPESAARLTMALADEDADVRIAAVTALGWHGFADDSGALLLALKDPSPRVQVAALKSLARRQQQSALDSIIALIGNSTGMILISALQAAFQISPVAAMPYLMAAEGNPDPEVSRVAKGLVQSVAEKD